MVKQRKSYGGEPTETFTIRVASSTRSMLDTAALAYNTSAGSIVNDALEAYLASNATEITTKAAARLAEHQAAIERLAGGD